MGDWRARIEGRECDACGVKRDILRIYRWWPEREEWGRTYPARLDARARCIDTAACIARRRKREERGKVRAARIQLTHAPGDPLQCAISGHCAWCGVPMWWTNKAGETKLDKRRSYHRGERGERDCRKEVDHSYAFGGRDALFAQARNERTDELRCVDCDTRCAHIGEEKHWHTGEVYRVWIVDTEWEADHDVALEDGGEHVIENLRCRCGSCHRAKTGREAAARAAARATVAALL